MSGVYDIIVYILSVGYMLCRLSYWALRDPPTKFAIFCPFLYNKRYEALCPGFSQSQTFDHNCLNNQLIFDITSFFSTMFNNVLLALVKWDLQEWALQDGEL